MKRILIIATLIASISTVGVAQRRQDNPKRDGRPPMKELNLTDEQKQKIKSLNDEYRKKEKDLSKERQTAIQAVLTPEQQTKMESLKNDRKKYEVKRKENRKPERNFAKKREDKSEKNINRTLSPETIAKLNTLEDNYFQEKQAIQKKHIALEEQKEQMTELRKKYRMDRREAIREARKQKRDTENRS